MAATVQISETNGSGATVTDNITNSNMGNVDSPNLVTTTYPITAGTYSYEKWQRLKLVNLGGSNKIMNIKVWRTGNLSGSDTHKTNAATSGYSAATYQTPVKTQSSIAVNDMPTSEPTGPNLGIGGSLSGELTSNGTYSDYLVHQIYVDANTTAGASCTLNFKYEEVA